MENLIRLLAFGAGALCLGVALTLAAFFALMSRHESEDSGEGCLGTGLVLSALAVAAYLFLKAVTS
jgi:hypothetical protein